MHVPELIDILRQHAAFFIAGVTMSLTMNFSSVEANSSNSDRHFDNYTSIVSKKAAYSPNQKWARFGNDSSSDSGFVIANPKVRFDDRGPGEIVPEELRGGTPVTRTAVTVTSTAPDQEEHQPSSIPGQTDSAIPAAVKPVHEHHGFAWVPWVLVIIAITSLLVIWRTRRPGKSQEPPKHPDESYNPPLYPLRIAIKFKTDGGKPHQLDGWQGPLGGVAKDLPPLRPWSLFGSLNSKLLSDLVDIAQKNDPHYKPVNWLAWSQVETPAGVNADELVERLRKIANIETAYAMVPSPPPVSVDKLPQHYQEAAPDGIDARHAWGFEGGDGAGIGFVDLEQGWNLDHEDLKDAKITLISGVNRMSHAHGTSVLGQVLMVDNDKGGVGIAPSAQGRVISLWRTDAGSKNDEPNDNASTLDDGPPVYNTALAIADAAAKMSPGDVLLLEVQERDPASKTYDWPAEVLLANYEQICTATAKGIIVIEAAGNGGHDLDSYKNEQDEKIFDRSFRDSGAIIVGAASSRHPHIKCPKSNHGKRIDCYAWGQNVDTTASDEKCKKDTIYTKVFGGTSGASPIVAGAALILQGIAQAAINRRERNRRLGPRELRDILKANGTKLADGSTETIGVMPNLRAIISANQSDLKPVSIVEPPP